MANFTELTNNLNIISALSDLPNQSDGLTSSQLKAKFDEAVNIIKTYINDTLIAELEAQGASDKIGAVVGGASAKLQDFIDAIELAGTGNLPPAGSVTNTMMATDTKIGSLADLDTTDKDSVTDAINEVVASVGGITAPSAILTTEGDMMYRNATVPTRLAKGAAGTLMRMNSGATAPEWMALGTAYQALVMNSGATGFQWLASLQSLMTAAGDIVYASGANSPARLEKGTDGYVLEMVSGLPAWASKVGAKGIVSLTNQAITASYTWTINMGYSAKSVSFYTQAMDSGADPQGMEYYMVNGAGVIPLFSISSEGSYGIGIGGGGISYSQSATDVIITDAYISGTQLVVVFSCTGSAVISAKLHYSAI